MTWNSRIAKIFPGLAGISIGKMSSNRPKTLRRPRFAEPYLANSNSVSRKSRTLRERAAQAFRRYRERQKPTSRARSNTRANTDKKQGKMGRRFDAFFSRTTAFALRVFPTHCKLTRGPGCVRKMMTPATTCNSRFAGSIPRLTESSLEKRVKIAPAPRLPGVMTLPSELRFVQTLYRWKIDVESFSTICCMTHFEYRKTSKTAFENRVRKRYARENQEEFGRGLAWWIRLPRGELYDSRGIIMRRAV